MHSPTIPEARKMILAELIETFDHEISLISAVSFLILVPYVTFHVARIIGKVAIGDDQRSMSRSIGHTGTTIILLLLWTEIPSSIVDSDDGLADLIQGTDLRLNEILEKVPLIRQGPLPPFYFRNRHIQFIPWMIQNEIHRQEGISFQRIHVEVTDCHDKLIDCRSADLIMNDTITLDIFPPFIDDSPFHDKNFNKSSPIILFSPGLRCYSQDMPGNMIIRKAYEKGIRSVVVNRRGHTPDQPLRSPRWNLFGDVDDLEQVYWYVKDNLVTSETPMFLHGISSGTSVTVTALAKWDRRRIEEPNRRTPVFVSSIAVTPGYDISKVLDRERFLFPYNDVLLGGVKEHFVVKNEELLRNHNNEAVDKMLAATSLQELVNAAVPFAGYKNASHYYQDTNPINELRDITTPKLVLNSIDDPCCNIKNLYEQSPYPQHEGKTFAEMISETPNALVAVTRSGSHCPFLCSRNRWLPITRDPLSGGWMLNSWADEVSIQYYLATLDVYGYRRFMTNATAEEICVPPQKS